MSYRRNTYDSKTLPPNADDLIRECRERVHRTLEDNNLDLLINMNQTFVLYDSKPLYTYSEKGVRRVDIRSSRGNKKLGCTVALTITADGRKAPAEVIFRNQPAAVIEELQERAPDNVRVSIRSRRSQFFLRTHITKIMSF